jgi:CheY-like chemotaxis protein
MSRVALVVDDSMLIRHTVCRFLEERGFVVESATNGVEALGILETVLPDILISDLQMPHMSGPELISRIKESKPTAAIPVVVLAGRSTSGDAPETRADYVIYKDIDIEQQLLKALNALLGHSSGAKN